MDARSALFDLYGDHLRARGGAAPVAALVRLTASLDIAAPAVRTAVSRMVRQDWLVPIRLGSAPGYALTPRAVRRIDAAAQRIYRSQQNDWDGTWHVLVVRAVSGRSARERLRAGLAFLGYGDLDGSTWISPRRSPEVDSVLDAAWTEAQSFTARHDGDPASLVGRAWNLGELAASYSAWLTDAVSLLEPAPLDDEAAFSARTRLVHEWRKFLFRDPGLPRELLPTSWPGTQAAHFFDQQAGTLQPAASRFVSRVLAESA